MSQRLIDLLVDSFWKILIPGFTATIPLTVISFFFAMIIATVVALIQFAKVPVLTPIARFYIWIIRGTPPSCPAFCHILRPAESGNTLRALPRRRHRLCHKHRRV